MTTHPPYGQEQDSAPDLPDAPGRRLRVARQAQGLELDQVASSLHLGPAVIESLERDDYAALPGEVFVVGYIQKYARLVGLDPEPLLAAYRSTIPRSDPARVRIAPAAGGQIGSGHLVVRLVSGGILILLVALTYLWWQGQQPIAEPPPADFVAKQETLAAVEPEPTPESVSPPASDAPIPASGDGGLPAAEPSGDTWEPEPAADAPAEDRPENEGIAASTPVTDEAAVESEGEVLIEAADAGSTVAASQDEDRDGTEQEGPESIPDAQEVVISFDGPCWVDVRDSEGTFKLFGEMKRGDRHVLLGEPPYSIILGNAAAARITVGDEPYDFSKLSRGNVARFTLNPGKDQGPSTEGQGDPPQALAPIP